MQKIIGDGEVCIVASGVVIEKVLAEGESISASSGCLLAMESTVGYDLKKMKGAKNTFLGGEGLFLAGFHGPGKIYLQGLPYERVVDYMSSHIVPRS